MNESLRLGAIMRQAWHAFVAQWRGALAVTLLFLTLSGSVLAVCSIDSMSVYDETHQLWARWSVQIGPFVSSLDIPTELSSSDDLFAQYQAVMDVERLPSHFQRAYVGIQLLNLLGKLVAAGLTVSLLRALHRVVDGSPIRARMLFEAPTLGKSMALILMISVRVFLGLLLLIVPGIVAIYRYAMADHILADHPEWTIREGLQKSDAMTLGYRGKLFGLSAILFGLSMLTSVGGALLLHRLAAGIGTIGIDVLLWLYSAAVATVFTAYTNMCYSVFYRQRLLVPTLTASSEC